MVYSTSRLDAYYLRDDMLSGPLAERERTHIQPNVVVTVDFLNVVGCSFWFPVVVGFDVEFVKCAVRVLTRGRRVS